MSFYRTVDWLRRMDGSPKCPNTIPRNPRLGHRTAHRASVIEQWHVRARRYSLPEPGGGPRPPIRGEATGQATATLLPPGPGTPPRRAGRYTTTYKQLARQVGKGVRSHTRIEHGSVHRCGGGQLFAWGPVDRARLNCTRSGHDCQT